MDIILDMNMRTKFIYALCDPDTGAWRYIGASVEPRRRLMTHASTWSGATDVYEWIKSLGRRPDIEILDQCGDDWKSVEQEWIEAALADGIDLLNTEHVPGRAAEKARLGQARHKAFIERIRSERAA